MKPPFYPHWLPIEHDSIFKTTITGVQMLSYGLTIVHIFICTPFPIIPDKIGLTECLCWFRHYVHLFTETCSLPYHALNMWKELPDDIPFAISQKLDLTCSSRLSHLSLFFYVVSRGPRWQR